MPLRLNILVVEDHDPSRDAVVTLLRVAGHEVIGVASAEAVDDEGARVAPNLLITDLNLPGENGISLVRRFRAAHPMAGIIMITASESSSDRAEGYRSGVDLHLIKPLDFDEIQSAVAAMARRLRGRPSTERGLAAAELTLDVVSLQLSGPNQSVTVSSAEMLLLSAMARAAGQRLENWQIIELLGEDPSVYSKAALEVRVVRLRKKMRQAAGNVDCIRAVRGSGYQLCVALKVS